MSWGLDDNFTELFLKPADNYRWAKEAVTMPRLRSPDGRRCIYQENHGTDIERGYRHIKYMCAGEEYETHQRLNPLKDTLRRAARSEDEQKWLREKLGLFSQTRIEPISETYSKVKYHLSRQQSWLFTQYPAKIEIVPGTLDTNYVRFEVWDFDVHVREGDSDEIIHSKCRAMYRQINEAQRLATRYGFSLIWFTSPGDLIDGAHHQGRYAVVIYDEPVAVAELLASRTAFRAHYGIAWETTWDTSMRNTRLPGQLYVDLCAPDTLEPVARRDDAAKRHQRTAQAIQDVIDDEALCPVRAMLREARESATAPSTKAPQPAAIHVVTLKPDEKPCRGLTPLNQCRRIGDTFAVFNKHRKIGHRAAVRFLLNKPQMDRESFVRRSLEKYENEFISSRPATSRTAQNACRALRPYFEHYYDRFDARKLKNGARAVRDEQDRERIEDCLDLDEQRVAHAAKKMLALTYRETCWFVTIYRYIRRFNGRLSYKLLYGPGGIVPTREWSAFHKKISSAFVVKEEYVAPNPFLETKGSCRQFSLSRAFVQAVERREQSRQLAEHLDSGFLCVYKVVAVHLRQTVTPRGPRRCPALDNACWITTSSEFSAGIPLERAA